jgi:hypothetical protein
MIDTMCGFIIEEPERAKLCLGDGHCFCP